MKKINTIPMLLTTMCFSAGIAAGKAMPEAYVIGGDDADVSKFKSYAQLRLEQGQASSQFCGGSILSDTLILTAAHCLYYQTSAPVYNVPGNTSSGIQRAAVYSPIDKHSLKVVVKNPTRDVNQSELKAVKNFYAHPSFKFKHQALGFTLADERIYDIAIIELQTPINPIDNVESITLPFDKEYDVPDTMLDMVGLGYAREDNGFVTYIPGVLQYGQTKLLGDDTCYVSGYAHIDKLICTIHPDYNRGDYGVTGQGDSGGPLYYNHSNGQQVQVGIVNSGSSVHSNFTELIHYQDWINDVINNEGYNPGSPLVYDQSLDTSNYHSVGDQAPDPVPTPEPEPTPDPVPTPEPEPTPDPVPTPEPVPTPGPVPTPEPEQTPDPAPTLEPQPAPALNSGGSSGGSIGFLFVLGLFGLGLYRKRK